MTSAPLSGGCIELDTHSHTGMPNGEYVHRISSKYQPGARINTQLSIVFVIKSGAQCSVILSLIQFAFIFCPVRRYVSTLLSPLWRIRTAFVFDYTYVESSRPLSFIYYNKFITRRLSSVCSIEISVIFFFSIIIIIIMFVLLRQGNVQ